MAGSHLDRENPVDPEPGTVPVEGCCLVTGGNSYPVTGCPVTGGHFCPVTGGHFCPVTGVPGMTGDPVTGYPVTGGHLCPVTGMTGMPGDPVTGMNVCPVTGQSSWTGH